MNRSIILSILILAALSFGCYSERKAKQQFSKAAIAYPEIPAEYCSITYPTKDSTIRDTLTTVDTLIDRSIINDTLIRYIDDTVQVTIIKTLPGKTITKTITVIDTVFKINTAELKSCQLDNSSLTRSLEIRTSEYNKANRQAKTRGISLLCLLLAIGVWGYFKIKSSLIKK